MGKKFYVLSNKLDQLRGWLRTRGYRSYSGFENFDITFDLIAIRYDKMIGRQVLVMLITDRLNDDFITKCRAASYSANMTYAVIPEVTNNTFVDDLCWFGIGVIVLTKDGGIQVLNDPQNRVIYRHINYGELQRKMEAQENGDKR